ncbi:hypothetical protein [Terriglobus sp. RCC_193]|uniref:hypothetical protein n=1 Tax=Terriglobus sp. RCC_193 TaxID=3239218 RepID=UPI0035240F11
MTHMNVVVWLKSKWRVIVGGVVVALAWLLFTLGVVSAEEAFGMAMSGAALGGFSQSLSSHKAQVIDALDAQKQWHEQRDAKAVALIGEVAVPLKPIESLEDSHLNG